MNLKARILDLLGAATMFSIAPVAKRLARRRSDLPLTRRVLDRSELSLIPHHYYEPIVLPQHIVGDLTAERALPGLDLNSGEQLSILRSFDYPVEIREIADRPKSDLDYSFEQTWFGPGDAEYLYSMVRRCKPKTIIEVGCGNSTKMIRHAIEKNAASDSAYACRHVCIDPYESPWLEKLGAEVIRQPVERIDLGIFQTLGRNDILFIDSSHVIKPQGDVVFLYLAVLPTLRPGVFIHAHDIFTPRDYFPEWVLHDRRMWDEQYLLEAFLCFNSAFKITGALNWLWHNHRQDIRRAFPMLARSKDYVPASFWFERV